MSMENCRVSFQVTKNDVVVPEVSKEWESLTEKQLLHLERKWNNVMDRMIIFGEKQEKPAGDDTRGKLEVQFTLWNKDGFEAAWQGNRWTGIRGAEMDFMIGLMQGELAKVDKDIQTKEKQKGKAKAK